MKTAVIYYSLGGATRSYARAEADARGGTLLELRPAKPYNMFTAFVRGCPAALHQKAVPLAEPLPDLAGYERIVLMAPVWAGYPAPPFNSALAFLPKGAAVEVLLVSSSGDSRKAAPRLRAQLEAAGCTLVTLRDIRAHQ